MKSLLSLGAFTALAYGLYDFYKFMNAKRIGRWQQNRLEIWEGEGGAVPVAADRTAAQVRPKNRSSASSPSVG